MTDSYDPVTRSWLEREQADEERRRLERVEREGGSEPPCPDCGRPMARVAGPNGPGWTCVTCNAAGDPEHDHPAELHIQDFQASAYLFPRPSDPDADRPCSCDESLALKAAVLELQNQLLRTGEEKARTEAEIVRLNARCIELGDAARRAEASVRALEKDCDYYQSVWQIECERTVRAVERFIAAESEANANRLERERLEARVRELEERGRHVDGEVKRICAERAEIGERAVKAEARVREIEEERRIFAEQGALEAEAKLKARARVRELENELEAVTDHRDALERENRKFSNQEGEIFEALGIMQDIEEGREPVDAARSVKTDANNRLDEVVALRERIERASSYLQDLKYLGSVAIALEALRGS